MYVECYTLACAACTLSTLQLSPVVVGAEGIDGEGASPALAQRMMSPGGSQRDSPRCDLSRSQVEPEFEAHSPQLSALGREQVCVRVCGMKEQSHCSTYAVKSVLLP